MVLLVLVVIVVAMAVVKVVVIVVIAVVVVVLALLVVVVAVVVVATVVAVVVAMVVIAVVAMVPVVAVVHQHVQESNGKTRAPQQAYVHAMSGARSSRWQQLVQRCGGQRHFLSTLYASVMLTCDKSSVTPRAHWLGGMATLLPLAHAFVSPAFAVRARRFAPRLQPTWWDAVTKVPPTGFTPRIKKRDIPHVRFIEDRLIRYVYIAHTRIGAPSGWHRR